MSQTFDASMSLAAFDPDIAPVDVIEMSQSKRLVTTMVPGVARQNR